MAELNEKIAENIKSIRKNKGLSQAKFATLFDKKRGSVDQWERAIYAPTIDILIKLADMKGCSLDYLVGRDFDNPTNETPAEPATHYGLKIEDLKSKNDSLRREIITLKELVDSKNEIIDLYKSKNG